MSEQKLIANPEQLNTRELLRRERKQAYEAAKASRRKEREAEKNEKREEKRKLKESRDKELWSSLQSASNLDHEKIT